MSPQLLRGAGSYFFEGSPVGCLLVHGMGTFQYPQQSKKVLAAAYEVFKENQALLSHIHIPVLVINSRKDRTVPLENAHYLIEHVSSTDTTLLTLNDSAHLPTLDYDKERVQVMCLSFIERILAEQRPM